MTGIQPAAVWRHPIHFLSFGFGTGLSPRAPGTFGTLAGIPFVLLLGTGSVFTYAAATALLFVVGIYLCDRTAHALGVHDHPAIVWDEVVGYLVTCFLVPLEAHWLLLGFLLFRVFDILKPWPISWIDRRVTGGFGIMLDDLLAAVPAWLLLQGAVYWAG